jgi:hypothetical protein
MAIIIMGKDIIESTVILIKHQDIIRMKNNNGKIKIKDYYFHARHT